MIVETCPTKWQIFPDSPLQKLLWQVESVNRAGENPLHLGVEIAPYT
jgi:hypothetical protein